MTAKTKYPMRAALARFLPIRNHLFNLENFLLQAGHHEFTAQIGEIRMALFWLERAINPLREK